MASPSLNKKPRSAPYDFCLLIFAFCLLPFSGICSDTAPPLLLQRPAISRTQIVFVYGGDLWIVGRDGGDARRLTTGLGIETDPAFSPDGSQIAFTGEYDGNVDVYVVPAAGGVPRRLTWHPAADVVVGWTPDGKRILFRSNRDSYSRFAQLVHRAGWRAGSQASCRCRWSTQAPTRPTARASPMCLSRRPSVVWKRYRGGRTTPIWIADLADLGIEKVPRDNSNDFNPMWVGDTVYFLSDRNGPVTLFSLRSRRRKKLRSVSRTTASTSSPPRAGPGAIVYEQFGAHPHCSTSERQDAQPSTSRWRRPARGAAALREGRPGAISVAGISPTGARAVFEARGEIFTVPPKRATSATSPTRRGGGARSGLVAGRQVDRLFLGRIAANTRCTSRAQNGIGEARRSRLGEPAVVLLRRRVVARQQEDRVHRQAPQPLVRRSGERRPGARRHGHVRQPSSQSRPGLVARTAGGSPTPST